MMLQTNHRSSISSAAALLATVLVTGSATSQVNPLQLPAPSAESLKSLESVGHYIRWGGVVASAFAVLVAWFFLRIVRTSAERLTETFVSKRMMLLRIRALIQFGVYLGTSVLIVLLSVNLSENMIAILGGTAAVAIGFGIKDLAASVIAGITIMIDQPFQVGDRVAFGDYYGDIVSIGLRSVRLQTLDDSTVTIPNNLFQTQVVSCGNAGALDMQVVVDFHIGASQNVQRARELIREAVVTSRYVYLAKPVIVLAKQVVLGDLLAVRLRVKAYVIDTEYEKLYESDVTLRVLAVLEEHGVGPPALLFQPASGLAPPSDTLD